MTAPTQSGRISVAPAVEADVPLILRFIQGIAEYEKLSHEVETTEERLRQTLFGPKTYAHCLIGRYDGSAVGFAIYFYNYSTFVAKPGIHLEDLFVWPDYRGKGVGKALLLEVVRIAKAEGCGRVEWSVLDWNEPSIQFYKGLGAVPMDEWTIYRLTEQSIADLLGRVQQVPHT